MCFPPIFSPSFFVAIAAGKGVSRGGVALALALALGLAATACKPTSSAADKAPLLDTPYARDLDRICNAEEQSGALDKQPGDRAMHVAIWLATELESQEARDLSAALSPMAAPERGTRLKSELAKFNIQKCEMLHAWGQG